MKWTLKFKWEKLGILMVLVLFVKAWFYGGFIDEQENMAAGWLISQGLVIYRDFFLHHTPLPYFISSALFIFGRPAWWWWRVVTLTYALGVGALLWLKIDHRFRSSIIMVGLLMALAAPKFNLTMFLADTFFALSFFGAAVLLWNYWRERKTSFVFTLKWLLFFFFVSGWSTIVAVPPLLVLLLILFSLQYQREQNWLKLWQASKKPFFWFVFSCAVFPVYFVINGAFDEFLWSTLTYNNAYYFPLRLAETASEQRWGAFYYAYSRFGLLMVEQGTVILHTAGAFILTLKGLITSLGSVSIAQFGQLLLIWLVTPVTTLAADAFTVLAASWWGIVLALIWRRKWLLLAMTTVMSGLLFMRSNEVFHLSVVFLVLFWAISVWWLLSWRQRKFGELFLAGFVLLVIIVHFAPSYLEHLNNRIAIISPHQLQVTRAIEKYTQPDEKIQVVGGGLPYYWLSHRLPASHSIIYYPWFQTTVRLRQPLFDTLAQRTAQLVILEGRFDPELVKVLETNYSEIEQGIYQPKR